MTALAKNDALRASERQADWMTDLSETELLRRLKISEARRAMPKGTGDGGEASRRVRQEKARAFAERIYPVMKEIAAGQEFLSYLGIAEALNARQLTAPRGGPWSAKQVQRVWELCSPQQ